MEVEYTPRCSPAEVDRFVEMNEDEEGVQAVPTKESPAIKEDTSSSPVSSWNGFKLVGDNLDKTVKPRYMRMNRQNRSLNYFHAFAVKDRIDLSSFSSYVPYTNIGVNTIDLLPSEEVHSQLMKNLSVLVSRILVDNMPVFKFYFEDAVQRHLNHEYSSEMSRKSDVVSMITLHII